MDPNDGTTTGDARFPLQRVLGMVMGGDEPGVASARVDVTDQHLNPNGVVHGAVLFAMVDTAMGKATMEVIDEGCICASIEVQLRFIRPAPVEPLEAVATVVRRGRQIVHLDARVTTMGADRLIATAAGTFAVIRPPA